METKGFGVKSGLSWRAMASLSAGFFLGLNSTSRMKKPDVAAEREAFDSPSQDGVEIPAVVLFSAPEPRGVLWEQLRAKSWIDGARAAGATGLGSGSYQTVAS